MAAEHHRSYHYQWPWLAFQGHCLCNNWIAPDTRMWNKICYWQSGWWLCSHFST